LDVALAASAGLFAASSPSLVAASRHAVGEFAQIFSPVACALPIAAPVASPALVQIVGEVACAAERRAESRGQGIKLNTIESQKATRIRNHKARPHQGGEPDAALGLLKSRQAPSRSKAVARALQAPRKKESVQLYKHKKLAGTKPWSGKDFYTIDKVCPWFRAAIREPTL
jgi:hypothetical protein